MEGFRLRLYWVEFGTGYAITRIQSEPILDILSKSIFILSFNQVR